MAVPPPDANENSLIAAATAVITALAGGLALIIRNYFAGRHEASAEHVGRHVILEQAELRDFGDLPKQMELISQKMDAVLNRGTIYDKDIQDFKRSTEEILRIVRRLEGELEVAKRLREEALIARRNGGH